MNFEDDNDRCCASSERLTSRYGVLNCRRKKSVQVPDQFGSCENLGVARKSERLTPQALTVFRLGIQSQCQASAEEFVFYLVNLQQLTSFINHRPSHT